MVKRVLNVFLYLLLRGQLAFLISIFDLLLDLIQVVFSTALCRLDPILNLFAHLCNIQLSLFHFGQRLFAGLKGTPQDRCDFLGRPRSMLKSTFSHCGGRLLGRILQNLLARGADAVLVFEGWGGRSSCNYLVDGCGFRVDRLLEAVLEILKLLVEYAVVLELERRCVFFSFRRRLV